MIFWLVQNSSVTEISRRTRLASLKICTRNLDIRTFLYAFTTCKPSFQLFIFAVGRTHKWGTGGGLYRKARPPRRSLHLVFCIPRACMNFFSVMFLASVHHPDFMAYDVSASWNLDSELPLKISTPGLLDTLDRFRFAQCSRSFQSSTSYTHNGLVYSSPCVKTLRSHRLILITGLTNK